jgi:hypothetical protein
MQEDNLSTRDIAGGGGATSSEPAAAGRDEARFEREDAAARGTAAEGTAGAPGAAATTSAAGTTSTAGTGPATTPAGTEGDTGALLPDADQQGFVASWQEIQTRFVDDPRNAVEEADQLVATVMQRLADGFAQERDRLEGMWGRGEDVGTEDLRVALQRYRAFFHRLLSA